MILLKCINLNKIINWVVFDHILLIFYVSFLYSQETHCSPSCNTVSTWTWNLRQRLLYIALYDSFPTVWTACVRLVIHQEMFRSDQVQKVCVTVKMLSQMKHQLDATLCRFYFCRVTLRASGASAHHQEYLKLVQRPLVHVLSLQVSHHNSLLGPPALYLHRCSNLQRCK